ncbi:GAF and ANTAR domain-containing protein [Kribbella sp. GL6]|uniref:GAF and ANTAR domain-containing protein n=1 Tax=Kribbella sp. GL6 TaxID=3419765 RepID=UPI003D0403DF
MSSGDAEELFARLAVELHDAATAGVDETARTLVEFVQQTLSCRHVCLSLSERGRLDVVAASDGWVEQLDRAQLEHGEGPLPTAFAYDTLVWVREAQSDPRWPAWSDAVTDSGAQTVLQMPLRTSDKTVGVLGLYGTDANAFSEDDRETAQVLAHYVAEVAVSTARRTKNLAVAMDARKLVGQALAVLMRRYDIDDARAFKLVRRRAQAADDKLRDVVQWLVDSSLHAAPGES